MLLTERLAEEGVEIFVVARRMRGMPPAVYSDKVRVCRAWSLKPDLHTFEAVTLTNILVSLSFCLGCAWLLLRHRREYDIIHFHGASLPLFVNFPLAKLLGKKVVAKVAGTLGTEAGALRGRYRGLGDLLRRLLRGVDAFIATSSQIESGLLADGVAREKIARIPNFIDPKFALPDADADRARIRERIGLGDGPTVVFSGRFIACKGVDHLLWAWQQAAGDFPDARLLLLGDGPLLEEMKGLARGLGVGGSAEFRGHVANVAEFLRASDVFVLPSLQEGMPNSLLEAMACGLPPVATRIGGVVDIVRDGENGILVAPGDAAGLAAGIRRFLGDRTLSMQMAKGARKTILDHFLLDKVVTQYLSLYGRLTQAPPSA
jgi:glycosyltransferase involved in cell wall biosynthesis